jgi:hypothetical protein
VPSQVCKETGAVLAEHCWGLASQSDAVHGVLREETGNAAREAQTLHRSAA